MDPLQKLSIALCLVSFAIFLWTLVPLYYCIVILGWHFLDHLGFISPLFPTVPHLTLIVCIFNLVVSIFGCVVATSYNRVHLFTLAVLTSVMFVLQCSWAYLSFELRIFIRGQPFSAMDVFPFVARYVWDQSAKDSWDELQMNYFCCGTFGSVHGYQVWKDVGLMNNSVPDSCCLFPTPGCGHKIFEQLPSQIVQKITTRGCMRIIELDMMSNVAPILQTMGIVGGFVAVLQIASIALSCATAAEVDRSLEFFPDPPRPKGDVQGLGRMPGETDIAFPLTKTSSTYSL